MGIAALTAPANQPGPWLTQDGNALWVGALIVLALVGILLALGMTGISKSHKLRLAFRSLIVGQDNRLSTSKTIAFVWTAMVAWMLVTEALRDLAANVSLGDLPVSDDYLLLLGGPFAAAVLAKGIVVSRLNNGTLTKTPAPDDAPLRVGDLVSADDGSVDLVDFQYSLFNLIALGIVIFTFVKHPGSGLPAVPSGLLSITSASALTYVGNKAITSSTPSIARFTPGVVRAGEAVTIAGANLMSTASDAGNPIVTIGGMPAAIIGTPSPSSLQVRVPYGLSAPAGGTQAPVTVVADSSGTSSADSELTVMPDAIQVTQITPSAPPGGSTIVLHGSGFLSAQSIPPADPSVTADPAVVVIQDAGDGHELSRVSPDGHGPAPTDTQLSVVLPTLFVGASTPLLVSVGRGTLTSSPAPMTLGQGPPGPVAPAGTDIPRTVDSGPGFAFGVGVCTVNGQTLTSAVAFTKPPLSLAFEGQTKVTLCQSRDEVYSALDIEVDTSASYGIGSVSSKFKWAQSQDVVDTQLNLVVRAAVASPQANLSGASLTPAARQLLETGNFTTFMQRYGDRFVFGQAFGGEYIALLTIDTQSEDDRQTIAASLEASLSAGEFSGSVQTSVTSTLNTFSSQITTNLTEFNLGGNPPAATGAAGLNLTPDSVMSKALGFAGTINGQNAYPLQSTLSDYSVLDMPDPQAWLQFLQPFQVARQKLLDISLAVQTLQAQLQQVNYVLAHPDLYGEPETQLNHDMSVLQSELTNAIGSATSAAHAYAAQVAQDGSADLEAAPDPPSSVSVPLPLPIPILTYQILLNDDHRWAVSCPDHGDQNGPLVLLPTDADSLGQQWQIPQVHEATFTITNVRTWLRATRNDSGGSPPAVLQTAANDETVLWRFDTREYLGGPASDLPGDLSVCRPESVHAPGEHLNLYGDTRIAGQPIITYWDFTSASTWTLVPVPVPAAPPGGLTAVTAPAVPAGTAW
jgi:hypothetical protein